MRRHRGVNRCRIAGVRVSRDSVVSPRAMEEQSIAELVSSLRSSFRKADFDRVENLLVQREESVLAAAKSDFSEALTLKERENIELEAKCEALRMEMEDIRCRSAQLEERAKKAEDGFRVFAAEQERKQREVGDMNAALMAKVKRFMLEKSAADAEAEKYKNLCRKLEDQVLKVKEEQKVAALREREALVRIEEMKKRDQESVEKILQLQAENSNMECAQRKGEAEAMDWKKKYGELEALSLRLVEKNLSLKAKAQGMFQNIDGEGGSNLPTKQNIDEIRGGAKSLQIRKLELENADKKADGAVQAGVGPAPAAVIEIIDSEDEMERKEQGCLKQNVLAGTLGDRGDIGTKKFSNELYLDLENDGATLVQGTSSREPESVLPAPTPKRKRASRIIMSDSESAENKIKIRAEEAKRNRIDETEDCSSVNSHDGDGNRELMTPSRHRLVPLSQRREVKDRGEVISPRESASAILSCNVSGKAVASDKATVFQKLQYPVVENVTDHELQRDEDSESVESDSEGESLGGFIVNELIASDNECSASEASQQEVSSDSSIDQIFARIRREKHSAKWHYEADMLASFGKDPVLCMKAVCALYRQQTADEQSVKKTLLTNNRGFSSLDARRGSSIVEFLTGGNSKGPLTKSVKELKEYDPTAVEYCLKLATHYSKQLFMIYQNGEDPYFLPT